MFSDDAVWIECHTVRTILDEHTVADEFDQAFAICFSPPQQIDIHSRSRPWYADGPEQQRALQKYAVYMWRFRQPIQKPLHGVELQNLTERNPPGIGLIAQAREHGGDDVLDAFLHERACTYGRIGPSTLSSRAKCISSRF